MDLGRDRLHAEESIHAEPDGQTTFLRFNVDVAGPLFEGFDQQFVHQPNHRRRLSRGRQFAEFVRNLVEQFDARFGPLSDELVDRVAAHSQFLLDQAEDFLAAGEHKLHAAAADVAQLVDRLQIERIGRRQRDCVFLA